MAVIAFIGVGNMGGHMVRRLIAAGHTLRVYARRAAALQPYVQLGAVACASPREAAVGAAFVLTNVTNTADVESVLVGAEGAIHGVAAGTVVCDFSTIDVDATRSMAARFKPLDAAFLDCPVSGGTKAAEAGTLTIMVGGEATALELARPLLAVLGTNIFHMGGVGNGQVTKACNQIVQVINIQGIAEAIRFASVHGVDAHKVVEALMSGFAGSKMLGLMGPKMAARDFAAGIEARLHHKDFGLVSDMATRAGLSMPATQLVHAQLTALMAQGWGTMDTCNLLRVLEAPQAEAPQAEAQQAEAQQARAE
jgi:3-hydroxyisobutyrate dehydrogenase-like beta-hydroxyacid dehydrogenase